MSKSHKTTVSLNKQTIIILDKWVKQHPYTVGRSSAVEYMVREFVGANHD